MASMLDCGKIQAGLSEYLDNVLSAERGEATRAHLSSCAVCTKVAEELAQTSRLLAFLPRPELSANFEQELTARLAGQVLRPKPTTLGEKLSAWWIRPRVRPAVASVLAVAALIPTATFFVHPPASTVLPEDTVLENTAVERAMQEHLSARTSEIFGDSSGVLLASAHNELERGS